MNNVEKKLEEILSRLENVENILDPPYYKKILNWCIRHFILILIISVLAYFTWKVWVVIELLQVSFEALRDSIVENTNSVQEEIALLLEKLEPLKFWK